MRTVTATRYVTPLREGGSLPAIVEADDSGLYVVKFRAAGHGTKALIAELVSGELARAAGLRVPEIVAVEVDAALGRNEPDSEIRELLRNSTGTNIGLDYLPGSITFDPTAGETPGSNEASELVWFDAFTTNVDRTPRNPNLLVWHRQLWLIDHGSSLYFHHAWDPTTCDGRNAFAPIKDHVLLPWAGGIAAAGERIAAKLNREVLAGVLAAIPDAWLADDQHFDSPAAHRAAYAQYFERRLAHAAMFVEEAEHARDCLV